MTRSEPVFIHAWWRSGSSYVWSKLRANQSLICYYEPLNEKNSDLNLEITDGPDDIKRRQDLRHPIQDKSYYAEYSALVSSNNLRFSSALSYDRFFRRPEDADDELRIYLDGLLTAASAATRTPVLCFCRSQMRSAWIKRAFGGIHIAQIRNPFDQWASFHVTPYFRAKMLTIAMKLRSSCPAAFTSIETFERFARYMSKRPDAVVEPLFERFVADKDVLAVFLIIWMASALQAISCADFVLDIDRLSTDPHYRKSVVGWFEAIGCPIDFSDCALPSSTNLPVSANEFEQALKDAATVIRSKATGLVIAEPAIVRKMLGSLSPLSRKALRLALEYE